MIFECGFRTAEFTKRKALVVEADRLNGPFSRRSAPPSTEGKGVAGSGGIVRLVAARKSVCATTAQTRDRYRSRPYADLLVDPKRSRDMCQRTVLGPLAALRAERAHSSGVPRDLERGMFRLRQIPRAIVVSRGDAHLAESSFEVEDLLWL